MDRRARNREHEAREVAKDNALLLGKLGSQQRAEHIVVQLNHPVEDLLSSGGAVAAHAVEINIEHVERGWIEHVARVDDDEPGDEGAAAGLEQR